MTALLAPVLGWAAIVVAVALLDRPTRRLGDRAAAWITERLGP